MTGVEFIRGHMTFKLANFYLAHDNHLSLEGFDFRLFFARLSKKSDLFCNREKGNVGRWIFQEF